MKDIRSYSLSKPFTALILRKPVAVLLLRDPLWLFFYIYFYVSHLRLFVTWVICIFFKYPIHLWIFFNASQPWVFYDVKLLQLFFNVGHLLILVYTSRSRLYFYVSTALILQKPFAAFLLHDPSTTLLNESHPRVLFYMSPLQLFNIHLRSHLRPLFLRVRGSHFTQAVRAYSFT